MRLNLNIHEYWILSDILDAFSNTVILTHEEEQLTSRIKSLILQLDQDAMVINRD